MGRIECTVTSQTSKNTAVFIDGFNVYHFIAKNDRSLLWLDYMQLSQLLAPVDKIVSVDYFSAFAFWNSNKVLRHTNYVKALKSTGVNINMGTFADKDKIGMIKDPKGSESVTFFKTAFRARKQKFYTQEEKQTDVAIGVKMYKAACQEGMQKIILISNDTDFVPALREISEDFPKIRLKVYAPFDASYNLPSNVRSIVSEKHHKHLRNDQIRLSQLPHPVVLHDGTTISKPSTW